MLGEEMEELQPLTGMDASGSQPISSSGDADNGNAASSPVSTKSSTESSSSISTSLYFMDRLNSKPEDINLLHDDYAPLSYPYHDDEEGSADNTFIPQPTTRRTKWVIWIFVALCLGGWVVAFFVLLAARNSGNPSSSSLSGMPLSANFTTANKTINVDDIASGKFNEKIHSISWIAGAHGEDGLLLEQDERNTNEFLRVRNVTTRHQERNDQEPSSAYVLMKEPHFTFEENTIYPQKLWPSPDLKKVLVVSSISKSWRHSFTGLYWIYDVETQVANPLDPAAPWDKIQLASWSPLSDAAVFTRGNNMFIRKLSENRVRSITADGGPDLFYGIPDWVYEEEVFEGNRATWYSNDGKYVAFLRTNESAVPEFPVQYFFSHSEKQPLDRYPDVLKIKYPKVGTPNPIVSMQLYDVEGEKVYSISNDDGFPDDSRIVTDAVWASNGQLLIRETNRESDKLKIILVDVAKRTSRTVRSQDFQALDGGWVEVQDNMLFIPADPSNGRPDDGYIATYVSEGYNHLAYFHPLDNPNPHMLTRGKWEVTENKYSVDLKRGLVYFTAARPNPWERNIYSVKLDGSELTPLVNSTETAYYHATFSDSSGYLLLSYRGPGIPWQKVVSAPANQDAFEEIVETNSQLGATVSEYTLPSVIYHRVELDNYTVPVMEYRPANFDPTKKYPVLFHPYAGPGSQSVDAQFRVDIQSSIASSMDAIIVTVDGRGTGYNGRSFRTKVRDSLGRYESEDQIAVAKIYAAKPYVDPKRIAIWGWSYGGFMTLKTLEKDAGRTFRYGVAVAPVCDFRYYGMYNNMIIQTMLLTTTNVEVDSIYTERYMHMSQQNPAGYEESAITNTSALGQNERFLIMHGTGDDNVHIQNTLSLLDKLDLSNVPNYDVHIYPDSDHSISFHGARHALDTRM